MLLVETKNRKILLTGDGSGDDIIEGSQKTLC
jgi:hypothetical protein